MTDLNKEENGMPVWLQIAGAIASALLSHYTAYDDTKVQDFLRDISHNVNQILQRLGEISSQIDGLFVEIAKLPEEVRRLLISDDLSRLNSEVGGAATKYAQLVNAPNDPLIQEQIKNLCSRVSDIRTEIQFRSTTGEAFAAPMAAVIAPMAFLLELGLLERLGSTALTLRKTTIKSYLSWFDNILDPSHANSVASYVRDHTKWLNDSDNTLLNGILGPAVKTPGTRQAVYALENQVDTPTLDKTRPWYRVYSLSTVLHEDFRGDHIWKLELNVSPKFEEEMYARISSAFKRETDEWYTPPGKPPYTIEFDHFNSGDTQRFDGQTARERIIDIMNSAPWRNFETKLVRDALRELASNNEYRGCIRFGNEVIKSVNIAKKLAKAM
jgi:hypothetical protein